MRALTIALTLLATPALADVTGTATVIDGDTIEVHGQRIRLHGIDAPESRQLCRLDGTPWQCGKDAADALEDKWSRKAGRWPIADIHSTMLTRKPMRERRGVASGGIAGFLPANRYSMVSI